MSVLLETSAGDLVIDLFINDAPKACLNFLKLCKSKYYNFAPVYNLQAPQFFQAGDPMYPVGDGGVSCWGLTDEAKRYFNPERSRQTAKRKHERGIVSMACSASGAAGSQFFVSLMENEQFDGKHAIFGRVVEGEETLDLIASQPVDGQFRPLRDVRIKHTIVLEDPFDDPDGFIDPGPESPLPSALQLSTVRIDMDEVVDTAGDGEEGTIVDEDAIEAAKRAREAEGMAQTLETLGDLPFASIRPPENILFVCKLNPVTTSEDLDLIFGRFGKILSCQVVRDSRTGDSLQYAFIEFDVKEDAERAYFKMQDVLIDDRRIHVDFSQSVASVKQGQDPTHRRRQGASGSGAQREQKRRDGASAREYDRRENRDVRAEGGRSYRDSRHEPTREDKYELVYASEDRDGSEIRGGHGSASRDKYHYSDRRTSHRSDKHDRQDRDRKRHRDSDRGRDWGRNRSRSGSRDRHRTWERNGDRDRQRDR